MDLYRYRVIPSPDHLEFTRVLTLAPGLQDDPLTGTLSTMSVVDPVHFEALSYVWGRDGGFDTIECDGKLLQITQSVSTALRRMRDPKNARVLWADQVCINQQDLIERSQQVRHMSAIYQRAANVLVWLGDDTNGHAEPAFALVKSLANISRDPKSLEEFREQQGRGDLGRFPAQDWKSLSELFKQPWFDRKWILQEIGTDAPSELFWGSASLNWADMSAAAALLKVYGYALRREYDLLVWKPWYMDKLFSLSGYTSKALCFTYELHRARWQLASDPRDHIFALLGHPAAEKGPDAPFVPQANYTKPVEQVFLDFTVNMLQRGDTLMILNTVQHENDQLSQHRRSLPTWVTQWDSQNHLHNLLGDDTCVYNPSGNTNSSLSFDDGNRILIIDGLIIDTITQTTPPLQTADITLSSTTILDIWESVPESFKGGLNTDAAYPEGEPALFAFLETLSAIKGPKGQPPVLKTQRLADGADFLVKAFGEDHAVSDDIRQMAESGNCFKWMEKASGGAKCRTFARSQAGYYALCPPATRRGDKLCLLFGGKTMFCLRPDGDEYRFVGECYVHGLMDGEALEKETAFPKQIFRVK
ncbi:hypothetical protein OQA88_2423 [Cercophora sp. LCS_1]